MVIDFDRFVATLESLTSDGRRSHERRKYPRVGVRARVNIILLPAGEGPGDLFECGLRDLSARGLGLVTGPNVKFGQMVLLRLARVSWIEVVVPYAVRQVQKAAGDLQYVGVIALCGDEVEPVRERMLSSGLIVDRELLSVEQVGHAMSTGHA